MALSENSPISNLATALDDTLVQSLKAQFRGELLRPGEAGYDEARRLFNANVDKRPALIARCVDVADVIAAVNFGTTKKSTIP